MQQKRLIFGLTVFVLLVVSQIAKGLHLELVALLLVLPVFLIFFKKSRQVARHLLSLQQLQNFYKQQAEFQQGHYKGQINPEQMFNTNLARDLDLGAFFYNINYCSTQQGRELLNRWLCQDFSGTTREQRQNAMQDLLKFPGVLRRMLLDPPQTPIDFARIEKEMKRSFFEEAMPWKWIVPGSWFVLIAVVVLGLPSLFWKITLLVYVGFSLSYMGKTQHLFSRLQDLQNDFSSLLSKIKIFERLAENCSLAPALKQHQASQDVASLATFISFMSIKTNPIIFYILNLLVPWDFLLAELSEKARARFFGHFQKWGMEIVHLEALINLTNLAIYHNTSWAEEGESFVFVKELSHPLIDQSQIVTNDFNPGDNHIIIITGSNMSGKSTFLRALGLNLCLANIGAPVFAQKFVFKPMRLMSCIRVSDSLRDGQSYFYAEVKRMKSILEGAKNQKVFFLIDEPLRGTNNRERLIGNQNYLSQILQAGACGFISTHDLELTQLADNSDQIDNYHFGEKWDDEDLRFDYKIKQGPSQSTNALKILKREGLMTEAH